MEIQVIRDGVELTAYAIRKDPAARAAVGTLRDFDRFIARHDAPEAARIPDGFTVELWPWYKNASGTETEMTLGGPNQSFRRSTAESPAIVAHEGVHGIDERLGLELGIVNEGWSDAVGQAYARSAGAVGADDWIFGRDVYRGRGNTPTHMRDMVNPEIRTIGGLRRSVTAAEKLGDEERWGRLSGHRFAGLITRPAALAAARVGTPAIDEIYTRALLHKVGPEHAASMPAAFDAATAVEKATGSWPLGEIYVQWVRSSAAATRSAALELHKPGSAPVNALDDAWRAVGVRDLDSRVS